MFKSKKNNKKLLYGIILCSSMFLISACGGSSTDNATSSSLEINSSDDTSDSTTSEEDITLNDEPVASSITSEEKGSRDSTPVCLVPVASGEVVYENKKLVLDASNAAEGYVVVTYLGDNVKVKLQIIGSDNVTYTYNLHGGEEVFPLSAGSGTYSIMAYENISGSDYSTIFSQAIDVVNENEFGAFLYPNQYVLFDSDSEVVLKAEELAQTADNDLDVISNVYNYIIKNISYDYDKASNVQSGYIPDVDEILEIKTGICLDYASVMTAMLRSQNIPTRLEVGYAAEAYHAWISAYIDEIGWVNGIIQFDGVNWELMDPTFAANTSEKTLKNFIGDGTNYTVKYIY